METLRHHPAVMYLCVSAWNQCICRRRGSGRAAWDHSVGMRRRIWLWREPDYRSLGLWYDGAGRKICFIWRRRNGAEKDRPLGGPGQRRRILYIYGKQGWEHRIAFRGVFRVWWGDCCYGWIGKRRFQRICPVPGEPVWVECAGARRSVSNPGSEGNGRAVCLCGGISEGAAFTGREGAGFSVY